jgi:PhnB protein
MQLNPYLIFAGQCEAAFKFYEKSLGGKSSMMMTYGESPMSEQVPTEWRGKVMHARMVVGDNVLMGSDVSTDRYEQPKGFSVSLSVKDPAEAERIFHELEQDGTVQMALQKTFWSARFGMVVDRFGIPWMINCEQPS